MDQLSFKLPWITSLWIISAIDCKITSPLLIASDHNLLKMKKKWRLKNNVLATPSTKRYRYANLRRLRQFSDDTITAANHMLTDHILLYS